MWLASGSCLFKPARYVISGNPDFAKFGHFRGDSARQEIRERASRELSQDRRDGKPKACDRRQRGGCPIGNHVRARHGLHGRLS
jgi:hypothetical protein